MQSQTTEEIKKLIMAELPNLIKKEPDIRDFILNITGDRYAGRTETESRFDRVMGELKRDREAREKKWEAREKRWEAQDKKVEIQEKRWEAQEKKWEENQRVIHEMLAAIKNVDRRIDSTIGALGSRWGLQAEGAFRDGLKAILEESFGVKVERYEDYDHEGVIFGRPEQIELDLIIKDATLVICEIKSSMSKSEMYVFWRKKEFYEAKHNLKAARVLVISPMIDPKAMVVAKDLGIETYGYAGDVRI